MQPNDRSPRIPILTATACLICVVIFIAVNMQSSASYDAVRRWGMYSDLDIFRGAYWALITTAFVHVQPIHLIFNFYWLWHLGGAFERNFGPLIWLAFVLGAAFVSSGIQLYSGSAGIGMSGVGYALFGFGWMARSRIPDFARIVNDQTVLMFIGWGILCIITTYLGIMNIANLAHGGGFVFGAGLGMVYASKEGRIWPASAVALLAVASVVPVFYNPMSVDWVGIKASDAFKAQRWNESAAWYKRALSLGGEPAWAWHNLALIYGQTGQENEFQRALAELAKVDPQSAKDLAEEFAPTAKPPTQ